MKEWPHVYELPRMPVTITAELEKAQSLTASTYHGVVCILYQDLLQYTL